MKKLLTSFFSLLLLSIGYAQVGGINYKALISENGTLLSNQVISIRFTLLENGTTSVYQETQTDNTDANGIIAFNIGEGSVISGDFSTIDWGSNTYFLKVEINTGTGYQDFGTSELKYVPYAKYAEKAGNVFSGDFNDLTNIPAGLSDGDDDTHLTDADITAMGYIKDANDADHDPSNEIQTLTKTGNTITLSNGGGSVTDSDTHLSDTDIAAMGYIKDADDADHDPSNEFQNLTLSGTQLSISDGNNVNFTGWDTDASDDFSGDYNDLNNKPETFLKMNGDLPTDVDDNIYHMGKIVIGSSLSHVAKLFVEQSGNSTGTVIGINSDIENTGSGYHYGMVNNLSGAGQGNQYGIKNNITNSGDNYHYGIFSILSGSGMGEHSGTYNALSGTGNGRQYGVKNNIYNSGNSNHYGVYSKLYGNGSGDHYGSYNLLEGTGSGRQYGLYNKITNSGNGNQYGTVNYLTGSGTGNKYGTINIIDENAGGTHYAIYGEATKPYSYAGYFIGDVLVSKKIKAVYSGNADMKAFIYGVILASGSKNPYASSSGFTNIRESTGVYKITFIDTSIQANQYLVMVTKSNNVAAFVSVTNYDGYFKVFVRNLSGNAYNGGFNFVVFKR